MRTTIKNSKRVINKPIVLKDKNVLLRIEKEQCKSLSFEYLCQAILPLFFRELKFISDNEDRFFTLGEISCEIDMDESIAYLKFKTTHATKTITISDNFTKPCYFRTHFFYDGSEYEKQLSGDLFDLYQEILISIRDVWNFSHPNLNYKFL